MKNENILDKCKLCPRECGVNRNRGELGVCGQSATIKAARASLHMWEEPCISGTRGSGTVFFAGCNLHCVFCQNSNIANAVAGREISVERLAQIFLELQEQGANNINLVTAGHFLPQVIRALDIAKNHGLLLPIVYNTSSYESVESIRILEGYIDVYLPDLKYKSGVLSRKYSHAEDYFLHASNAIAEMVRQTGRMEFYPEGCPQTRMDVEQFQKLSEEGETILMGRGTIVRYLLMPGTLEDGKQVISYLLDRYGEKIFISMMNQYTPMPGIGADYPQLDQKVSEKEYEELIDYAIEQGIENGFIQEGDAAMESFIPEFDERGI